MLIIPVFVRRCCAAILMITASQTAVLAHASLEQAKAPAGQSYKGVIKIGHGCEQFATREVTVTIPDGVIAVKPMPKAGWTLTTRSAPYGKSYDYYHGTLGEGVREITWSGGSLPDAFYDEFIFQAYLARDLSAGTQLFFPVVQLCDKGRHDWVEKPAAGQDSHTLKAPAPFVTVVAAEGALASGETTTTATALSPATKAGNLVIEAARSRVTPLGAPVAGGYVTIRNEGTQPDRLVAASVEIADQTEIHEMRNKDGVMMMRALPDGLVIKPGETVELKPGSFHLMFLKPKRPLVEGEVLKGQMVFEKAGTIAVEFKVEGMGGNRPQPAPGHSGHVH